MFKTRNEETACALARQHGLSFGWTIFGGDWYVGTPEQLKAIGVLDPKLPTD